MLVILALAKCRKKKKKEERKVEGSVRRRARRIDESNREKSWSQIMGLFVAVSFAVPVPVSLSVPPPSCRL